MARKMLLDESIEFDPNAMDAAEEAAADVAAATRAARRKKQDKPLENDRPTAAILPIYLREMGSTPLIDEHKELELARELQEAREGLSRIAIRLPANVKDHVLEGDLDGPKRGREWPLDDMETFWNKVVLFAREHRDPKLQTVMREARGHKRHVDLLLGLLRGSPGAQPVRSKVIALIGARASVGTSTLGVHLGVGVQRALPANRHVALLDLGVPIGDSQIMLETRGSYSFAEAVRNQHRLDLTLVQTALPRHASGLALLALPASVSEPR